MAFLAKEFASKVLDPISDSESESDASDLQSDDMEMLVDSDVSSDNEVDSDSSESDSDGPSEIKKSRAGRRQGSWKSKKWFGD